MQTTMRPESDLQKRLEDLARRVLDDVEAWERSTRDQRRTAVSQITQQISSSISSAIAKEREREEDRKKSRAARRAEKKALKRAEERAKASTVGGGVMLVAAMICILFAVVQPGMWWMVFVALGFGMGGAEQLRLVEERKELARGTAPAQSTAAPLAEGSPEVDVICDQLLADLEAAPQAVRQFIQDPKKTIASMRAAGQALDARRRQLLAEKAHERLAQLPAQRQSLEQRRNAAVDEVARARLGEAIASLEGQRAALEGLAKATDRADGEYTSLLVSLQELRTRVSLARTAGTSVQLDGLRQSLDRLNAELEAISEALESVSSPRLEPVAPIEDPDEATPDLRRRERA